MKKEYKRELTFLDVLQRAFFHQGLALALWNINMENEDVQFVLNNIIDDGFAIDMLISEDLIDSFLYVSQLEFENDYLLLKMMEMEVVDNLD